MEKQSLRYSALALALLGAGTLLALLTISVTASQLPPPPSPIPDLDDLPSLPRSGDGRGHINHVSAPAPLHAAGPIPLPSPAWRIGVTADGLYRLTYEALAAAGVPVSGTAPADFHLLWRGQEVALQEVGTGDTAFDPGDALLFYGTKFHGSVQDEKYTDENVYWLTVDDAAPGLRMGSRSVAPDGGGQPLTWYTATVRAEENLVYWARFSTAPGTDTTWFWERIQTVSPVTRVYPITLTAPASGSYDAVLLLEVAGRSYNSVNPDHHLRLAVNGTTVGEVTWDGQVGAVFTVPVTSASLVAGVNQVYVTILTDLATVQDIYVDRVEIAYRRQLVSAGDGLAWTTSLSGTAAATVSDFSTSDIYLYDVTHPLTPVRLESATIAPAGATYVVNMRDAAPAGTAYLAVTEAAVEEVSITACSPSDLISPAVGADEIIIAPSEFFTALQPLVDRRRSQGLRVQVVDVQDVYALFNGGIVHPEAIRAFVAHAYENWPGRPPAHLLLVGDGDFNPKGYNPSDYGTFVPTLIPPYLEFADPSQGEVPVDSRYGDVYWGDLPEVFAGRIPAGSAAEAESVVHKILAYEDAPLEDWVDRVLLVADDGYKQVEAFSTVLDRLPIDYLPGSVQADKVYLQDYCDDPTHEVPCPAATSALTQAWSQGAALLTYAGHGSIHRWAHEPLLFNTHLASLTGTTGLPFLIALDCWDGYWMFPPEYPVLAGRDVRSVAEWATTVLTDRGAIAAFGPAGLAYLNEEETMARAMYGAMFDEGVFQLGPLTQVGREAIPKGYREYMARIYTLLGDPALSLPWWERIELSPMVVTMTMGTSITVPTTFVVTGTTRFGQSFAITPSWTADIGELDGWDRYTAPGYPAVAHLTAHMGTVSATVTVNVVPKARIYLPLVVNGF